MSFEWLVDLMSVGLVCVFGIEGKGCIVVGYDVDFSIVDLCVWWIICDVWIVSVSGWILYDGCVVMGWFVYMVVCG